MPLPSKENLKRIARTVRRVEATPRGPGGRAVSVIQTREVENIEVTSVTPTAIGSPAHNAYPAKILEYDTGAGTDAQLATCWAIRRDGTAPTTGKYLGIREGDVAGVPVFRIESFLPGTDEKVKVTSNDTTANYLLAKLAAGTGITLTETNDGGDEDVTIATTITQYTDELAQDAVGGALTDSTTVDFTYNDGANTITAAVIYQMSITADGSGLKLSGDVTSPGNSYLYGTNGAGVKGWYLIPSGGVTITVEDADSNPTDATISVLRFDQADRLNISYPAAGVAQIDFTGITVEDADSVPTDATILTFRFDQADGFNISYPAARVAQIDLVAALAAIGSGVTPAANTLPLYTSGSTANALPITTGNQAVLALTGAADKLPYYTGASTAATADITSASRTFLALTDPGADRIIFWDDSETSYAGITSLVGLSLSGTTLTAYGGGNGVRSSESIAATGSTQGDAATITKQHAEVTGADGTKGVILQNVADIWVVYNSHATNMLKVYPPSGGKLTQALGTDAADTLLGSTGAMYVWCKSLQFNKIGMN